MKSVRKKLSKLLKLGRKKKKEKSINPSEISGSVMKDEEVKPQNPCNESTNNIMNNSTNDATIPIKNSEISKVEKKDDCDTVSPREQSESRTDVPASNNDEADVQKQLVVYDKHQEDVTKVDGHVSAIQIKSAEDTNNISKVDITRYRSKEKEKVQIHRVGTDDMVDYVNNHKPTSNVFCGCI